VRRLHPVSPIFLLVKSLYQMLYPLAAGLAWSSFQSVWILPAVVLAFVVAAVWQFWFFRFALEDDQLLVTEGLIFRKNRKIPYSRVQNINTSQNPVHRFLGVATVQLESASGGKPEAVLRVVDWPTVESLRQKVQAAHATGHGVSDAQARPEEIPEEGQKSKAPAADCPPESRQILAMPVADVVRYGLVSQKGLLVFALISGFFSQNPRWYQNIGSSLAQLGWLPEWSHWSQAQVLAVTAALVLAVFLLLQLFTVAWALLRFYGFSLWQKPRRLFAHMGLLSRMTATIPDKRIQLYRIKENPVHQWLGGATVTVETAGGVNSEQQGLVMRWLAPYVPKHKLAGFLEHLEPAMQWQRQEWKPIPFRAWRRVFKRNALVWLLLVMAMGGVLFRSHGVWPLAVLALVFPLGLVALAWHAKAWVRNAGYVVDDSRFGTRSGVLFRGQAHVRLGKAQVVDISQSPFDRRHGTATLRVDTAGSNPGMQPVQVRYLPVEEAERIRDFVLSRLGQKAVTGQPVHGGNALQSRP